MRASPALLYQAWTKHFDTWFAEPPCPPQTEANVRIGTLEPDRLVEITWVTGTGGTEGAETVVTAEFTPEAQGTKLRLTLAGFATQKAGDRHEDAWPFVLEQLDRKISVSG